MSYARLEDLRASRARLAHAADKARQRLERNLHDGAQQRLVALSLTLRLAHAKLAGDPAGAPAAHRSGGSRGGRVRVERLEETVADRNR